MGGCCSSSTTSSRINTYMTNKAQEENRIHKLLLLGPGSTGKSTLFQSLQMSHSDGTMDINDRKAFIQLIRLNIIDAMYTLVHQSNTLFNKNPKKYKKCQFVIDENNFDVKNKVLLIEECFKQATEDPDGVSLNSNILTQLADAIETVWNFDCIQATYDSRDNNFAVSDNLDHFFNNIKVIMTQDYVPSEIDCLKNRNQTSGMNQYDYEARLATNPKGVGSRFKIVDVGGQRTERKKWINYFDNVQGLIFVASLVDYNRVLYEDDSMNGMLECVNLFETLINEPIFDDCTLILLLNKNDLLMELLIKKEENGLYNCFSDKGVWPNSNEYWDKSTDDKYFPLFPKNNDISNSSINNNAFEVYHSMVLEFIARLFHNRAKKQFYEHVTVATDHLVVQKVFQDIQMWIVGRNLENVCMINVGNDSNHAVNTNLANSLKNNAFTSQNGGRDRVASVEVSLESKNDRARNKT